MGKNAEGLVGLPMVHNAMASRETLLVNSFVAPGPAVAELQEARGTPHQSQGTVFSVCYDAVSLHESERSMTARILDGLKIRDEIFAELKDEVHLLAAAGVRPGLAAVLVGENPASQLYVKSKIAACERLGLASGLLTPPASVTTREE